MKKFALNLWLDISAVLRGGFAHFKRHRVSYLAAIAVTVAGVFLLQPHDTPWSDAQRALDPAWTPLARQLSYWGDFLTWTVPFAVILFLIGLLLSRPTWKRGAIACLLAASIAGLSANALCFTLGRPRPCASLPDQFYGPKYFGKYDYRSFPSGHSATAFGTATAITVVLPEVGVPCLIFAGGVAWSRLELGRHFPTDVFVGSALGIAFGVAFGSAARAGRRK